MLDALLVHNNVFDLLMKNRQDDKTLRFTLRKSNRAEKLDKGYWFYGNEWYLAVSFWTGMDWKNKTPNIIFIIVFETGDTYLEINTSDSDKKRKFINQFFIDKLGLLSAGQRFRKYYEGNYLKSLQDFLNSDKIVIDNIITENSITFFNDEDDSIGFIDDISFEEQLYKIRRYKSIVVNDRDNLFERYKIRDLYVSNYGPINEIAIENILFSSQWIFLTGENGTGKTTILRSITTAICNKKLSNIESEKFSVRINFYSQNGDIVFFSRLGDEINTDLPTPITIGFAAYGQSRLKTNYKETKKSVFIETDDLALSIFEEDSYLIDIQHEFDLWKKDKEIVSYFEKRKYYIKEILIDILPNLYNIYFDDNINGSITTTYIEKDNDGDEYKKVTFHELASGLKSMIAMIGDIMVRLYRQQPDIYDPAEFRGIVLIDEIDIHLHPKLQRSLVIQLSKTFPKIQFIATTHSPIPFLGAPKKSQIFLVERTREKGVKTRRLDEKIELGDLLPNTILTSPIFGLDEIIPESHERNLVRTETTYESIEFNDRLKSIISEFITDAKEQELINLFKSRRK